MVLKIITIFLGLLLTGNAFSQSSPWFLSGYLIDRPQKKVWIKVAEGKIEAIYNSRPQNISELKVIDTKSLIAPGLIDLHGHLKYNVLPLWGAAKSQFFNRFEWRKWSQYKNSVSFNMKAFDSVGVCAAVRWAEIKAISAGVTTVQGVGADGYCTDEFGAHNIEIAGEFQEKAKARSVADLVSPQMIASVYEPLIEVIMTSQKVNYDKAFEILLDDYGVNQWIETYISKPHDLLLGLELTLGKKVKKFSEETLLSIQKFNEKLAQGLNLDSFDYDGWYLALNQFLKKQAEIELILNSDYLLSQEEDQVEFFDKLTVWLIGKKTDKRNFFTVANVDQRSTEDQAAYQQRKKDFLFRRALDSLAVKTVLVIPSPIRSYLTRFEYPVRKSILKSYEEPEKTLAVIAHLAEGTRSDNYNMQEYHYAKSYGFSKEPLVIIHGVGMGKADFKHAAKNNVSIVWSPFSNLLLYGETLDVSVAIKQGVNIALGSDWSPTGGKNLLDEIKVARRYLDQYKIKVTNKQLIKMATENSAKALHLEHILGKVAPGYFADLMLIEKKSDIKTSAHAYNALVKATQKQVQLVVVEGEPVYGDLSYLNQTEHTFEKVSPIGCDYSKGFRFPGYSSYDEKISETHELRSYNAIEKLLKDQMQGYYDQMKQEVTERKLSYLVSLDPVFSCSDTDYTERFEQFIETELPYNIEQKMPLRKELGIREVWSSAVHRH